MADFSLSIAQISPSAKGTQAFWAPELIDDGNDEYSTRHSKETDMWAFGMTVFVCASMHNSLLRQIMTFYKAARNPSETISRPKAS